MRGKTIIRCARCHVGSDKRLILVFKGVRECMSCAAVNSVLEKGIREDADKTPEELLGIEKRID